MRQCWSDKLPSCVLAAQIATSRDLLVAVQCTPYVAACARSDIRGLWGAQGLEAALQQDMPAGRATPELYSGGSVFQRSSTLDYGPRGYGEGAGRPPPAAYPSYQHGSNLVY